MAQNDKKTNLKEILVIPLIIALLYGGTSPWWIEKYFSDEKSEKESSTEMTLSQKGKDVLLDTNSGSQMYELSLREENDDRESRVWFMFSEINGTEVTVEYDVSYDSTVIQEKSYTNSLSVPFETPNDNFELIFREYDKATKTISVELITK